MGKKESNGFTDDEENGGADKTRKKKKKRSRKAIPSGKGGCIQARVRMLAFQRVSLTHTHTHTRGK